MNLSGGIISLKKEKQMKKIAYMKEAGEYAKGLEEFGFEISPYIPEKEYDAVIYDSAFNKNVFSSVNVQNRPVFLLNVSNIPKEKCVQILRSRLYSSIY